MRMKLYRSFMLTAVLTGCLAAVALAQSRAVTGTVKDPSGAPIPGANIVVKGTASGTTADADGKFSVEVNGNEATLVVSFIGFATNEVQVGNQSSLNISLTEDAAQLQEVVVTALGIEKTENHCLMQSRK